jgi:hypothetical protein
LCRWDCNPGIRIAINGTIGCDDELGEFNTGSVDAEAPVVVDIPDPRVVLTLPHVERSSASETLRNDIIMYSDI